MVRSAISASSARLSRSAADWLELAELGMQQGLKDQARAAVASAVRLDPSSKLKGDAILRGQGSAKPTKDVTSASVGRSDGPVVTEKYQKSTPEQDDGVVSGMRPQRRVRLAQGVGAENRVQVTRLGDTR